MSSESAATPHSPTLEDVARVAGVSRATVSRVVNNTRNVDPELHRLVWQAIDATGYVPNRAARSLVTGRTGSIALVVSESTSRGPDDLSMRTFFTDPFFGRVVTGVLSALQPRGIHLALMVVGSAAERTRLVGHLRQGQADGAVVISLDPVDSLPEQLVEARVPAVLCGRPARAVPISYVDVANHAGAALAADHLVARGCQRVATISGPLATPAGQDRLSGFREAMARHGYPYVPSVEGEFSYASGEQAVERLLAAHPGIDGLFVANDLMAQGALVALRDLGRRVPEDLAVVGFDDSSAALASRPTLTTVRHPLEEMAAEGTRMLLARVEHPDLRVSSVIFEPALVVRQSA
jgi:DNA-binding LacI/PurR family transcriptional regulator